MNNIRLDTPVRVACETTEIVRGQEKGFLERVEPMVLCHSVELDLGPVERIDAAGVAALIRLYCIASHAGRQFTVANPRAHVAEILRLVGLDRVLMAGKAASERGTALGMELSAA